MSLIYLSPVPWASFSQRPHKFVEWFHRRTGRQVIWIEPYPTRFPKLGDFRRSRKNSQQAQTTVPQWLKVLTPCALPIEPLPGSGWLNSSLWASLIKKMTEQLGGQEPLIVVGKPSVFALKVLAVFKPKHSIYDAMDDFPAFYTGFSRLAMACRERQLVKSVEKVWASSTSLKNRWLQEKASVCFVPNALDDVLLPPPRRVNVAREQKVFGYVGTVGAWFDWAWIEALATLRSDDIIRIIGPIYSPAPFELPSNIELLPPCAHDIALSAMLEFDIALIPFKKNELTASVDPIKYYEYRGLGLPVISTDFGEMKFREAARGTFISKSIGDIDGIVVAVMEYQETCEVGKDFIRNNTWATRFDGADITL